MWKYRSMESEDRPASPIHLSRSSLWSQSVGTLIRMDTHHAPLDGQEGHWCGAGHWKGLRTRSCCSPFPKSQTCWVSSNSDEGILVPSPLHDNYSPEKEHDLKEYH